MTVNKLIEELKKVDGNLPVTIEAGFFQIEEVIVEDTEIEDIELIFEGKLYKGKYIVLV